MPKYEGCVEAKEISLTRKGANQHAHVLVRKNAAGSPAPCNPENDDMAENADIEKTANEKAAALVAKTLLWTDVTKAHFAALPAEQHQDFLAKSAQEQNDIAKAAKDAADKAAAEEELRKSGKTQREADLEKSVTTLTEQVATLSKALEDGKVERALEKRAETEFAGYPGGAEVVVPLLKSFAGLPEASRTAAEAGLKATIAAAKASTLTLGGITEDVAKAATTANERIEKRVAEVMTEKKMSRGDAYSFVTGLPEFAADVAAVNAAVR